MPEVRLSTSKSGSKKMHWLITYPSRFPGPSGLGRSKLPIGLSPILIPLQKPFYYLSALSKKHYIPKRLRARLNPPEKPLSPRALIPRTGDSSKRLVAFVHFSVRVRSIGQDSPLSLLSICNLRTSSKSSLKKDFHKTRWVPLLEQSQTGFLN